MTGMWKFIGEQTAGDQWTMEVDARTQKMTQEL
jgi:hypothetical protein